MAATSKPHRKKMESFVSNARKAIKKGEPNKAVRKEHAKKGVAEHGKVASKGEKNRIKAMY